MSDYDELFKTLKSKGSDAGYKNVTVEKLNGYQTYQYGANPDKLKTVSSDKVRSGNYETWKDYTPYTPFKDVSDMDVVAYRYVAFVNKDSGTIDELYIFTNNTNVDLYSKDIDAIINSVAVAQEE